MENSCHFDSIKEQETNMGLSCPKCDKRLSRWEVVRFFRLVSVSCIQCNSLLSLDKTGRTVFLFPVILSLLLSVICMMISDIGFIGGILLVAGFVVGVFCADKYGTLLASSEKDDYGGS